MIRNAILSLTQTVFSVIALFFSYRLVVQEVGVEQLGLWSLVFSILSLARICELGLSGSILKHVPGYIVLKSDQYAASSIDSATIAVSLAMFAGIVVLYAPFDVLLNYLISEQHLATQLDQLQLLAAAIVWFSSMAALSKLALEGCQRYDYTTVSVVLSTLVFLLLILILIPDHGINGLAMALLAQQLAQAVMCRIFLRRHIKNISIFPRKINFGAVRELINYGYQFQIITLIKIFMEPMTKSLLGLYGTVEAVGYYDLASKFSSQMRRLLMVMNQVIIPRVSQLSAEGDFDEKPFYIRNTRLVTFVSIYFFGLALSFIPALQLYWLSSRSLTFEIFSVMAVIAFFVNTLSIPAYMMNLGTGRLRTNIVSHGIMASVNLLFGVGFGLFFGSTGVVLAWALALIAGTIPIIYPLHQKLKIRTSDFLNRTDLVSSIFCLTSISAVWYAHIGTNAISNLYTSLATTAGLTLIGFGASIAYNPNRRDTVLAVQKGLSKFVNGVQPKP